MGEYKSGRRGVRVGANFSDTTLHDQEIWVIDVNLDTLEDSLDDILLGFVTVYKVFEDIGESDLMGITRYETRVFRIPDTQGENK